MSGKPTNDEIVSSAGRHGATRERIEAQIALVAALTPGSREHRIATRVLLLLQDGLFLLTETDGLLRAAGRREMPRA